MIQEQGRWPQRVISDDDLQFVGYVLAPHEAKPTAYGLWSKTNLDGRRELSVPLIAAELYPFDTLVEATDRVELHLLMLEDSGFLITYQAPDVDGTSREWIQLARPLKGDRRGRDRWCPPPPGHTRDTPESPFPGIPGLRERARVGASERARARAREEMRAESEESERAWAQWRAEQGGGPASRPERPLLLQAPPLGCADHPGNSATVKCGPCGIARKQHEEFLARHRYEGALALFYETHGDEGEPEGVFYDGQPF